MVWGMRGSRAGRPSLEPLEPRLLLSAQYYVAAATDPLEDGSEAHPFDSIQEGIDAAGQGDYVLVGAGTYVEDLIINTPGILLVSRTSERATIQLIDGVGIRIDADGVELGRLLTYWRDTLYGFDIRSGAGTTTMIQLADGLAGVVIEANTIDTTGHAGIGIDAGEGATNLLVESNEFKADDGDTSLTARNIEDSMIWYNSFVGPGSATDSTAIEITGAVPVLTPFAIEGMLKILDNRIRDYRTGIVIYNGDGAHVTVGGNSLHACYTGLFVGDSGGPGEILSLAVVDNRFYGNQVGFLIEATDKIRRKEIWPDERLLRDIVGLDVQAYRNSFASNVVALENGNADPICVGGGVSPSWTNTTYAYTWNWWGHASGPTHSTNPRGRGEVIIGAARLNADQTVTRKVRVRVDEGWTPGTYHLIAVAGSDQVYGWEPELVPICDELWCDNNHAVAAETCQVAWMFGDFDGRDNVRLTITDDSGNPLKVSLRGDGWGQIVDGDEGVGRIVLHGTTSRSSLTIRSRGEFDVDDIVADGSLRSITGKKVNLLGDITIDGALGRLVLGNVADNHVISIGASDDPTDAVTMIFGRVSDLSILSAMPIRAITATEWLDQDATPDLIEAPWLGRLTTKGARGNRRGIAPSAGDFQADLTLSGIGARRNVTLGNAKIAGDLGVNAPMTVEWDVTGDSGNIRVRGDIWNWDLKLNSSLKSLKAGEIHNASLDVDDAIGAVQAVEWDGGNLAADSVKSIKLTGDRRADIIGDLIDVEILLSGQNVDHARAMTLGSLWLRGWAEDSLIRVMGNVGKVEATALVGTDLLLGCSATTGSIDDFESAPGVYNEFTLKSLTLRGDWLRDSIASFSSIYFQDKSTVAAWNIDMLKLYLTMSSVVDGTVQFHELGKAINVPTAGGFLIQV